MKNINLLLLTLPLLAVSISCLPRQYPVTSTYGETAYRTESAVETYTENETTVETLSGQHELTMLYSWYSPYIGLSGKGNFYYTAYDIPQWPPYDNIRLKVSILKQHQVEPATVTVLDMTGGGHLSVPAIPSSADNGTGQVSWTKITRRSSGNSPGGSTSGVSDGWLDTANIQVNQALFLGGRAYPTFSALLPEGESLYTAGQGYTWPGEEDPLTFELNAGKAQKIAVIVCGPQNSWNARTSVAATWSSTTSYHTVTRERKIEKQVPYTVQKQKTIYETRQVPFWDVIFSP